MIRKTWGAISDGIARLEGWLLVVVLLSMIVLSVLQIILRNAFDMSLFWIDPFTRLMVLWLAMLGAMVATRQGEHIAIDVVRHYLSGAVAIWVVRLSALFAAGICALMAYHSGRFVYFEYLDGMTTFAELPAWPFELIMPIGFGIMAIRFCHHILRPLMEMSK